MTDSARHHPASKQPAAGSRVERIPDDLVDAFFDRELDEGSREKFFGMLRGDLARCEEVARTQRIVSTLREPVAAPDLTGAILDRIAHQRSFLPRAMRRLVHAGRAAVAAGILLVVLGVAVAHRVWPQLPVWGPSSTPVTTVLSSGYKEAASGVQQFAGAIGDFSSRVAEPVRQVIVQVESSPAQVRAHQRMYVVGALSPGQLPTLRVLGPDRGDGGRLMIYGGAGAPTVGGTALLPLDDRRVAVVIELGKLSPSRAGQLAWLRASTRDTLILVPAGEGMVGVGGAAAGYLPGIADLPVDDAPDR